jgi:hypothetical protein
VLYILIFSFRSYSFVCLDVILSKIEIIEIIEMKSIFKNFSRRISIIINYAKFPDALTNIVVGVLILKEFCLHYRLSCFDYSKMMTIRRNEQHRLLFV